MYNVSIFIHIQHTLIHEGMESNLGVNKHAIFISMTRLVYPSIQFQKLHPFIGILHINVFIATPTIYFQYLH